MLLSDGVVNHGRGSGKSADERSRRAMHGSYDILKRKKEQ
jgi:hypothetical protein